MNGVTHLPCRTQQQADCRMHLYGVRRRRAWRLGCISEAVLCNVWIAGKVSSPRPNPGINDCAPSVTAMNQTDTFLERIHRLDGESCPPTSQTYHFFPSGMHHNHLLRVPHTHPFPPLIYPSFSLSLCFSFLSWRFVNILWKIISNLPTKTCHSGLHKSLFALCAWLSSLSFPAEPHSRCKKAIMLCFI